MKSIHFHTIMLVIASFAFSFSMNHSISSLYAQNGNGNKPIGNKGNGNQPNGNKPDVNQPNDFMQKMQGLQNQQQGNQNQKGQLPQQRNYENGNNATPKPEAPKFNGSVSEIKTKGKLSTLVIEVDGKTQEVILSPKIKIAIESKGDLSQIKEGLYTEMKVQKPSENSLVAVGLAVYSNNKMKAPAGQVMQLPPVTGDDKVYYMVSGKVKSINDKSKFEGYSDLAIQSGNVSAVIQVPKTNFEVLVINSDPAGIKTGDSVELTGTMLKNGKLNITGVRVPAKN